jgi:cytochrome c551/c552
MINKYFFALALLPIGYAAQAQTPAIPADVTALLNKHTCVTCHKADKKAIGPSFTEIASKKYSKKQFAALVKTPVPANWPGYMPMAPLPQVPVKDLNKIADWVKTLEAK